MLAVYNLAYALARGPTPMITRRLIIVDHLYFIYITYLSLIHHLYFFVCVKILNLSSTSRFFIMYISPAVHFVSLTYHLFIIDAISLFIICHNSL